MTSKTIALSGAEIRADYSGGTNAWLRNDGVVTVYASAAPGVTAGADGVVSIPAGQAAAVYDAYGTVYLLGTGSVQLVGSDYTACPFKSTVTLGSVTEEISGAVSNPNLLINHNFVVNQRGKSGAVAVGEYAADMWKLESGTAEVLSDGTIKLTGTLSQKLEHAPSGTVTCSASAGAAAYSAGKFTLTASGDVISWAKLEAGSRVTLYSPPDYASELAKCQRYFQRIKNAVGKYAFWGSGYAYSATKGFATFPLAVPMRSPEACTSVLSGTLYAVNAAHIGSSAVQLTEVSGVEMINGGAAASINIVASGLTANTPIMLQFRDSASYLDISSEL